MDKIKSLGKYNKSLIALLTIILAGLATVYGDNEYVKLAIAIAGLAGVYTVPNKQVK